MKKLIGIFTILLLTGVVVFAQNAKPLSDRQMDTITAGNSGGHDDNGDDNNGTSTVTVSGAALSGVTTMNLVVSADSSVATGINVFSGNANTTPTGPSSVNPSSKPGSSPSSSSKDGKGDGKGNGDDGKGDGNGGHEGDDDHGNHGGLTQTNNISIEGSSSKASTSSVTLSDSAESGITATNIVNAASSAVASGINVAQSNTVNTTSFSQVNNVSVKH